MPNRRSCATGPISVWQLAGDLEIWRPCAWQQRWAALSLRAGALLSCDALQGFIFPPAKRIQNAFLRMIKNSISCSLGIQAVCTQKCATAILHGVQQQRDGASNNSRAANLVPAIPKRYQESIFFLLL